MNTNKLIKYIIMGAIMVLTIDSLPPKGIGDDTSLFLNPVSNPPPPAVAILLDTSGSMSSLPCAVPDSEDSCGLTDDGSSYFITQWGYHPNTDYGYDSNNTTCFDSNVSPGQAGCFYGGTDPNQAHVYINGYFAYNTVDNVCNQIPKANSGEPYGYRWYDCGTINYFCNNESVLGIPAGQCINDLTQYGYQYAGTDYWGNNDEAYFSGNLLNFYPPKFVITRKVMSDLITKNANQYTQGKGTRIGIFSFNSGSSGAETDVKIYPPCSQLGSNPTPGNFLNTLYSLMWDHGTPLAGALVQVGGYFANNNSNATWYNDLGCNGSSYCSGLQGANLGNACSANDSWCGCYNTNYSCEKNFVIVMTDGNENTGPGGLPDWPIGSYQKSTANESACSNAPGNSCNIDEVAGFLHANSIRPTTQSGCTTNVDTYTIGFAGTAADGYALNTYALQRAAQLGGGLFAPASNWQTLEKALYTFFANINQKNMTYGTPSLPQLLTAGGGSTTTTIFKAFIASFLPKDQTFWIGHLREYTGTVSGATGALTVYDKNGVPFSGNTSTNGQCSFSEYVPPPIWDAAADLSDTTLPACSQPTAIGPDAPPCYLAPNKRNVYTVAPTPLLSGFVSATTGNGDWTWSAGGDSTLGAAQQFTTTNINLSPAEFDVTDTTTMDKIIDYVLGPKQDGVHVLGDIFHSDPMLISADALASDYLGSTDFSITTLNYQGYLNAVYNRPQIVVAGADDGMIHAFYAGGYTNGAQFFNNGNYEPYTAQFDLGTGQEVWAFIPYDLLPKLQYMYNPALVPTTTTGQYWTTEGIYTTTSTTHVYYVDGSAYIRDVYLPNVDNGLGLSGNAAYWHTIMIVGERLGGTYYICLDITNTLHPKFMWEFTTDNMGFTFSKIVPHGPPVGPVWLGYNPASPSSGSSPQLRWVVMFSGGWDPGVTTNRGRGFYVVDIATGKLIWKFDQTNDSNMKYSTPSSVDAIAQYDHGLGHTWWMEAFLPDLGGQLWQFSFLPKVAGAGTWGGYLDVGSGLVKTCINATDTNCFFGQREFAAQDPPPPQSQAQQFYFVPSSIWDPCNNLWLGLASGDDNNPFSCSPVNYFYEFVQDNPYTPLSSVLTPANNMTLLTGLSGFSTPTCAFQPASARIGWYIALSSFSNTGIGAKSLNTPYAAYGIQYISIFTPDQNVCTTSSSSQFSCSAIGGTGVMPEIAISQLQGFKAGQLIYQPPLIIDTIPSPPLLTTAIYGGNSTSGGGGGGGGGGGFLSYPLPNPNSMPICNSGPGAMSAKVQCFMATSGGGFTGCGTIQGSNSLVYPYLRTCIPQNVENGLINPQNIWSFHPR